MKISQYIKNDKYDKFIANRRKDIATLLFTRKCIVNSENYKLLHHDIKVEMYRNFLYDFATLNYDGKYNLKK